MSKKQSKKEREAEFNRKCKLYMEKQKALLEMYGADAVIVLTGLDDLDEEEEE